MDKYRIKIFRLRVIDCPEKVRFNNAVLNSGIFNKNGQLILPFRWGSRDGGLKKHKSKLHGLFGNRVLDLLLCFIKLGFSEVFHVLIRRF